MGTQVLLSYWPSLRVCLATPSKQTGPAVAWKLASSIFWRLKINNLLKAYSLFQGSFLFAAECGARVQPPNNLERLVQLKVRWIQRVHLFGTINSEWYLFFFLFFLRLWLWQCTGQWEQFRLQETASTHSWMSLLLHSVCYRTLRIAQEQTVISSQDGGNSACSGTFQADWLSPTFPSTLPFFCCTILNSFFIFLLLFLQSAFNIYFLLTSRINLICYCQ